MLPFRLATRFLKSGRGQTILIIVGIAVAIAAQIFIGLLINSLQKTLVNRTIGNQAQVRITPVAENVTIQNWEPVVDLIRESRLVDAVSPVASGNAFIQQGPRNTSVLVRGLDAEGDQIYRLRDSIYEGNWDPSTAGVLVGKNLQEQFEFEVGDDIAITTPQGKSTTFEISGFYDLGVQQINQTWVITSLEAAQSLFDYQDNISSIEMRVNDYFQADSIASDLESRLNNNAVVVSNWKAENSQLLSGLQGQSISSLMIQIFIVVAVVIAIAAILAITVYQKSRQLGILKAMGIKDRAASLIFIYEGLIIGVIGAIGGVILGLLLFYGFLMGTSQPGEQPLVDRIIDYRFIAISWAIAVAAAVLAALIPARRSLRLNPIDVIREG